MATKQLKRLLGQTSNRDALPVSPSDKVLHCAQVAAGCYPRVSAQFGRRSTYNLERVTNGGGGLLVAGARERLHDNAKSILRRRDGIIGSTPHNGALRIKPRISGMGQVPGQWPADGGPAQSIASDLPRLPHKDVDRNNRGSMGMNLIGIPTIIFDFPYFCSDLIPTGRTLGDGTALGGARTSRANIIVGPFNGNLSWGQKLP